MTTVRKIKKEKKRIFNEMKYENRKMTWENFCLNHKFAVTTANRYIDFSNWCRLFPCLVVSGIELTTLESYREELDKYLDVDEEL